MKNYLVINSLREVPMGIQAEKVSMASRTASNPVCKWFSHAAFSSSLIFYCSQIYLSLAILSPLPVSDLFPHISEKIMKPVY